MLGNKLSLLLISLVSATALAMVPACGGDDDGGGGGTPDAAPSATPDAAPNTTPDAMVATGLTNLGETCTVSTGAECQDNTSATNCLQLQQGTTGFCSLQCGTDVEITANAMGQLAVPQTGHEPCAAAYGGTAGTGLCAIIAGGTNPPPNTGPVANTTYTVNLACAIFCGQSAPMCPDGLSCQSGVCQP